MGVGKAVLAWNDRTASMTYEGGVHCWGEGESQTRATACLQWMVCRVDCSSSGQLQRGHAVRLRASLLHTHKG